MAALLANHLVAMMRPHLDGIQFHQAPGRSNQRRLFHKHLRRTPLQPVHRRIFPINIIPTLSRSHSSPHLRRRPSNRIATQIHHAIRRRSNPIQIHHHIRPSLSSHVTPLLPCALCVSAVKFLPFLYFINSTKTSFDTLTRPGAKRTTLPSRSTNPAEASGSKRLASSTPYSRSIRPTSIPSNFRTPKNNSSPSALSALRTSTTATRTRHAVIAATYPAASSALAHRSVPENECAPAPNPKYASLRQYFKLYPEPTPRFAQLEIS